MAAIRGTSAFAGLLDLASATRGGETLLASDEFFAAKEALLRPEPAVFDPERYTDHGKWMDGWESRRERIPGHDWCIVRLGVPGRVRGVDIDTSHFLGNHPPFASLDACQVPQDTPAEELRDIVDWTPLLPAVPLQRGSQNLQGIADDRVWSHVRLNIHPDGGVARLRVFGEPVPLLPLGREVDLALSSHGGRALACSDMFFSPMDNLLLPGKALHMGHGWETRRSRPPGDDWIIIELAVPGTLDRIELDTNHFKGNFPDRAALDGLYWPDAPIPSLVDHEGWEEIVPPTRLRAHMEHVLPVTDHGPWTHVRMRIYPDGGVSRLRAWGRPATSMPAEDDPLVRWLNGLNHLEATAALTRCCGASRWVRQMVEARPYTSRTHLLGHAEHLWWRLGNADWLEAFTHHPPIGGDIDKLRHRFAATSAWSEREQGAVPLADEATLEALARGNREYSGSFGHVFIVCASGLTAGEMLGMLEQRLDNEPDAELRIAAGEQAKITRLRLEKLEEDT